MYRLLLIKRIIEDVFIFPFILLGRIYAGLHPLKQEYRVFFFFSFYQTGGAEKVHAQIVQAAGGSDCVIFFTRHSADSRFLDEFKKSGCQIMDISKSTDNKWLYFLNLVYRGIITGYINKQKQKPVVFNGQCNFAYKISPWINKTIQQVELIHSLNTFSSIRIPFIPFISKTVMISRKRIEDHKQLYTRYKIPAKLVEKIIHIPNGITLPPDNIATRSNTPFKILYSGRSSPEKRIHLITEMAKELHNRKEGVRFEMIGDVSGSVAMEASPYIKFHGNVSGNEKINSLYSQSHLLLITSSAEGFPMVVMEAMANGCAIMATPVGDIPFHVKNGENGFLFTSVQDEAAIIKEACEKILWLKNNPEQWEKISKTNIDYANNNFGIEKFNTAYQNLIR